MKRILLSVIILFSMVTMVQAQQSVLVPSQTQVQEQPQAQVQVTVPGYAYVQVPAQVQIQVPMQRYYVVPQPRPQCLRPPCPPPKPQFKTPVRDAAWCAKQKLNQALWYSRYARYQRLGGLLGAQQAYGYGYGYGNAYRGPPLPPTQLQVTPSVQGEPTPAPPRQ